MKNTKVLKEIKEKYSDYTIQRYARQCYDYSAAKLDDLFLDCFKQELINSGYQKDSNQILQQFKNNPVLQTAHHLTATNGPTFTAIDLVSLMGLEEKYYLVGVFSGVPFSNPAWSGSLSYGDIALEKMIQKTSPYYSKLIKENKDRKRDLVSENKIRLVFSDFRDDLVFGSSFEKYRLDFWDAMQEKILQYFPKPKIACSGYSAFSNWHLKCCSNLQAELFGREKIIYFDLCRLIKNYITKAINQKKPLLEKLFCSFKTIEKNLNPIWFYSRKEKKKSWKIHPLFTQDLPFFNKKNEVCFSSMQFFLQEKDYCPATFITFFILVFCCGIRCLGSFYQVEYLHHYEKCLKNIFEKREIFSYDWSKSFTSGRLKEQGRLVYPLDYILEQKNLNLKDYQERKMSFLWEELF